MPLGMGAATTCSGSRIGGQRAAPRTADRIASGLASGLRGVLQGRLRRPRFSPRHRSFANSRRTANSRQLRQKSRTHSRGISKNQISNSPGTFREIATGHFCETSLAKSISTQKLRIETRVAILSHAAEKRCERCARAGARACVRRHALAHARMYASTQAAREHAHGRAQGCHGSPDKATRGHDATGKPRGRSRAMRTRDRRTQAARQVRDGRARRTRDPAELARRPAANSRPGQATGADWRPGKPRCRTRAPSRATRIKPWRRASRAEFSWGGSQQVRAGRSREPRGDRPNSQATDARPCHPRT